MASLGPAEGERFLTIDAQQLKYRLVGPGQGLPVTWPHRLSPTHYARVIVRWIDADSDDHLEKTVTLKSAPPPVIYFG